MSAPRQFKINRGAFSRHYTVLAASSSSHTLYHVSQSTFTRDKAALTLHAGPSTAAPVVAVAHLPRLSSSAQIGLGDPSSSSPSITWEELRQTSTSAHEWSMTLPSGETKTFTWRRTHRVSADGMSSSAFSMRDLKLVDEATERVAAVFTARRGWSSCGVLQINTDEYGAEFDVWATATVLAVYEKARRRRARVAAGGASS